MYRGRHAGEHVNFRLPWWWGPELDEICPVDVPSNFELDYGYNEMCAGSWWQWRCANVNRWKYSHKVAVFGGSRGFFNEDTMYRVAYANVCAPECHPDRRTAANTRHEGTQNMLFGDGHVQSLNALDILNKRGFILTPIPDIRGRRRWY